MGLQHLLDLEQALKPLQVIADALPPMPDMVPLAGQRSLA